MPSEKFFVHKEDGSLVRLKGRLVRFLDEEPPTGSDKSAIRTALEVSPDAEGLVQADVGTAPNEIPVNGMLGDMAYQSADSVAMGTVEITDKIDLSGAPTQQLEVYGDAPTVRVTDTSDGVGDGDSIGKLEFYGNDGSSGGVGVRAKIDTVSETAAGNQYGVAISTSTANSAPVERVRVDGQGHVGIGTDSPGSLASNADDCVVGDGSQDRGITIFSATNKEGTISFADGTTGDERYRGFIKYDHDGPDSLLFGTSGTTRWSIGAGGVLLGAAGNGIRFDTGSTLDAYEHGDITSVTDASGAGLSITAQIKYQVIGKSVHISGAITFPTTSDTNLTRVTLLPEQCPNSNANRGLSVSYSTTGSAFYALPVANTNDVSFYTLSGGPMANNALSGVIVFISGNYSIN